MASVTHSTTLHIGSDNYAWVGMVDTAGDPISSATVTSRLLDSLGVELAVIAHSYDALSVHGAGYVGVIPAVVTLTLTDGANYSLHGLSASPEDKWIVNYTARIKRPKE